MGDGIEAQDVVGATQRGLSGALIGDGRGHAAARIGYIGSPRRGQGEAIGGRATRDGQKMAIEGERSLQEEAMIEPGGSPVHMVGRKKDYYE
jgi:hypothetical protein